MFGILNIYECCCYNDCDHIDILFDNGDRKTFCIDNKFNHTRNRRIEMYYVLNNIFTFKYCDNNCSADVYNIDIDDEEYDFIINFDSYEVDDDDDDNDIVGKPYCYTNYKFDIFFRELSDLVYFLREKHPELLKPVKLAIHE